MHVNISLRFLDWKHKLISLISYIKNFRRIPIPLRSRTFSEKLVLKRILDNPSNPLLCTTADKFAVREYVKDKIGIGFLPKLYHVTSDPGKIPFDSLTYPCVAKSTHGTAQVSILESRSSINTEQLIAQFESWLCTPFPLWYNRINPQIIIEEFLVSEDYQIDLSPPSDYKFFCFHGQVAMIQVDIDRFKSHQRSLFLPNWEFLNASYCYPTGGPQPKPALLNEMLRVAEELSRDFPFVRVDLYCLHNRIIFGELTHCPGGAREMFDSVAFDCWLGKQWTLASMGHRIPASYNEFVRV